MYLGVTMPYMYLILFTCDTFVFVFFVVLRYRCQGVLGMLEVLRDEFSSANLRAECHANNLS